MALCVWFHIGHTTTLAKTTNSVVNNYGPVLVGCGPVKSTDVIV